MTSTSPATSAGSMGRPTRQRKAIAAAMETFDDFRSAQSIHALVNDSGTKVGLATVYRALQAMAESDLIDSLLTESGESLYRRCSAEHHHHLVCRECRATVEIAGPGVEKWTRSVAKEHGYSDLSHTLEILGVCSECA